ncbi:YbhB/YbcL family Raf kinase inhibitor-like protein [Propionicimonas sp.]|uniref:YbhB/YbcL family Raf kinase inhibitor-like protein n=1 Tax=Propionicimonas sp. TaxID=1955623 RepID=UPI0039E72A8F
MSADDRPRLLVLLGPLLGRLLRHRRAGLEYSVRTAPELSAGQRIDLASATFEPGTEIPLRCCGAPLGDDVSPALAWGTLPAGTGELLLVVEDVDVPLRRPVIHLAALVEAGVQGFAEGALQPGAPGVRFLPDRFGRSGYHGPRPLPNHGPHRYGFHLYALNRRFDAEADGLADLLPHLAGHVLGAGFIEGWREG